MKKLLSVLLFLYISFFIFAQEQQSLPSVAIPSPYMSNDNTSTEFFNKQFIFEFMSNTGVSCTFEMLNIDIPDDTVVTENEYRQQCIEEAEDWEYDYILFSKVWTLSGSLYNASDADTFNLIFKYSLINVSSGRTIKSGLYNLSDTMSLNDILSYISKRILYDLNTVTLEVNKDKKTAAVKAKQKEKEKKTKDEYEEQEEMIQKPRRHEIYAMNGFLKPSVRMLSFVSFIAGYSFIPYKFFDFGGAIFLGGGSIDDKLTFENVGFDQFYFGTNTYLNFFLPGFVVEPSIGVKLELSYIVNGALDLYIPISLGMRIHLHKNNYIKIGCDIQFTTFNIMQNEWQNNYLIGLWIGYAKKL